MSTLISKLAEALATCADIVRAQNGNRHEDTNAAQARAAEALSEYDSNRDAYQRPDMVHIANEWADMAANGIQWLRNVRDGISTTDEAIKEMESNAVRILALQKNKAPAWKREVVKPTVTDERHGTSKWEHPAYGTVSAARVSGQANLFGSNVGHAGFVKIEVTEASMRRDGYSETIIGSGKTYIEIWLSEAQWVSFVSRMNVGNGTPCTLRHYGNREGMVFCPEIPDPEKADERMDGRISELQVKNLQNVREQRETIERLCAELPARKRDAILSHLSLLTRNLEANHAFAAETLREFKERLVTESKVEIDAMLTDAAGRFGLQTIEQLGQILAADPSEAMALLARDGAAS